MIPLVLSAGMLAADAAIQNIHGSGITTLSISDEDMEDIIKIVQCLEELWLLIKEIIERIL